MADYVNVYWLKVIIPFKLKAWMYYIYLLLLADLHSLNDIVHFIVLNSENKFSCLTKKKSKNKNQRTDALSVT